MIQRIQSVYLAVAAISAALLFVFPLAEFVGEGGSWTYSALSIHPLHPVAGGQTIMPWPVTVLAGLTAALCIGTIFLYKNRPTQLRIGKAAFAVMTALFAMAIFYIDEGRTAATGDGDTEAAVSYGFGLALPIVGLLCMWLANRAIRKDEELVKSVDRLR